MKEFDSARALLIFKVNMLGLYLLKDRKSMTLTNAFQKNLGKSKGRKPNKIWVCFTIDQ